MINDTNNWTDYELSPSNISRARAYLSSLLSINKTSGGILPAKNLIL